MWTPDLPTDGTPIFRQLFASIERAIADGVLAIGTKLPPQRSLAERLGVSVGTVTRAYEEADRQGLTVGHVGRGTFVAGSQGLDSPRKPSEGVDLSMNCPPMIAAERLLAETWGKVRRRRDFLDVLTYAPIEGSLHHRRLVASWLTRTARLETPSATRVVITAGCQAAMDIVISHLCGHGDTILAEELTFSGIKAIAQSRGYKLAGVPMDAEGIEPDSLVKIAKATGSSVLYTMPTLHNPTGRSTSTVRRKEIIKVARKAGITIVEDDNYAVYADGASNIVPLASLAPDICYYVSGFSKSIAPGLRTGFIVSPDEGSAIGLSQGVRTSCFAAQSMGLLIAQQAIEDGAAEQIIKENRRLVRSRNAFLVKLLGGEDAKTVAPWSPHVWIPMGESECERVEARLLREGVQVTPASVPRLPRARECGLRICVGAPRREEDFRRAASQVQRAILQTKNPEQAFV
jgi:DNA-binding transcriptional MocR family regulator